MKLSMPNKHLIFESQKQRKQRVLWIPSPHKDSKLYVTLPKFQTRETVFNLDMQTPRGELKIWHATEYFWRNSSCLDSWSMKHCLECLICLLNRNKNFRVNGEVKSSKSMLINTGYPNLIHASRIINVLRNIHEHIHVEYYQSFILRL